MSNLEPYAREKQFPYDNDDTSGTVSDINSNKSDNNTPTPKNIEHTAWQEADEAFDAAMSIKKSTPGGGAPVPGAGGGWASSPSKPWERGPLDSEENGQNTAEASHLHGRGAIMTLDEIKQVVDRQLAEARKAKKKKKKDEQEKTPGYTYAETFDFSKPLGELNLYRAQGASGIGPYTTGAPTNSMWPVLEGIVEGKNRPQGIWESLMFASEGFDEAKKETEDDEETEPAEDGFSEIDPKTAHKKGAKDPKALAAHVKKQKAKSAPKKDVDEADQPDDDQSTGNKTIGTIIDNHGREIMRYEFGPKAFDNKRLMAAQPAPAGQPGKPWPKGYQLRVMGPNGKTRYIEFDGSSNF